MDLSFFARVYFVIALSCALHVIAQAQIPDPETRTGTASISGRVTIAGQPAAGKKILLVDTGTGFRNSYSILGGGTHGRRYFCVVTDADGRYRFGNLPEGGYAVSLDLLGPYILAGFDAEKREDVNDRARGPHSGLHPRHLTLKDSEEAKNIDFALVRGGVITGRLTDAEGRPIVGARIIASIVGKDGKGYSLDLFRDKTDDRGVYRIYGLPAGRYRLSSDGSEHGPDTGTFRDTSKSYLPAFHPGVDDEKRADIVTVKAGSEVSGIDIKLGKRMRRYEVTGRVIDAVTRTPLSSGMISVWFLGAGGYHSIDFSISAIIDSQGNFRFAGLAAGRYRLRPEVGAEYYDQETTLEVEENKRSGIEIEVKRGATIKGRIVLDASSNQVLAHELAYAEITANIVSREDHTTYSGNGSSKIDNDDNFSLSGLKPGKVELDISAARSRPRPYLLRIERDGVEIPNGIEVNAGETISGIRLIVAYGKGIIRGQVRVVGGVLPEGRKLEVFASKGDPFGYFGATTVNRRGQFVFEGLMDGEYDVSVSTFSSGGTRPEFRTGERVRVTGGAETPLSLTLDISGKMRRER